MNRRKLIWHLVATALTVALVGWWISRTLSGAAASDPYPNRPIQVVVPYPAGGGSDTFVRILQKGIVEDDKLGQPLVVINQGGGGGTIGSRVVKDARPDGYKILCLHNAIITAELAGTASHGPDDFERIALTGGLTMVIMVREDCPFKTLPEYLEAAKERPNELTFGANQGSPPYYAALQMETLVPGAKLNIVSYPGGADRYTAIIGGHLDAGIFSLSEYLDMRGSEGTSPDQNISALVVMGAERHEAFPDVPTASEQGIPVVMSSAHYWWAPKGTPPEVIDHLATVFGRAMETQVVKDELNRIRVDLVFARDEEFAEQLAATTADYKSVAVKVDTIVPNFPLYTAIVSALFLLLTFFRPVPKEDLLEGQLAAVANGPFVPRHRLAAYCFAILAGYILLVQAGILPFAILTALMIFVIGGMMAGWASYRLLVIAQLALITAFGAVFVFTKVFTVPLP